MLALLGFSALALSPGPNEGRLYMSKERPIITSVLTLLTSRLIVSDGSG
jgi:hypothetical protein